MIIREFQMDDLPALIDIGLRFYKYAGFDRYGLNFDPRSLRQTILGMVADPQNCIVLVAEDYGQVVGTASAISVPWFLDRSQRQVLELWWWIEPEHRGKGIAKALLEAMETAARNSGAACFKMASLNVPESDGLNKWYESKGFIRADTFFGRGLTNGE